jgi:membrane-bound inhibitor of C-type lysozyme
VNLMKRWKQLVIVAAILATCTLVFYLAGSSRLWDRLGSRYPSASNTVSYYCREGVITATYSKGHVRLVLPDGRTFELPQAVAGSGIRFTNGKIEFWSKGANAFVTENNQRIYSDGVAGTVTYPTRDTATFIDSARTFSLTYPREFILSGQDIGFTQAWREGSTDLGSVLALVTIPRTVALKTNFGGAKLIIGQSSDPEALKHCFENPQGYEAKVEPVKLHGIPFIKFSFSDAGAGNLYETTSYRTKRGNACYVVEYTIRSSNIELYSPDQGIKEFDKVRITKVLDRMVESFRFLQ